MPDFPRSPIPDVALVRRHFTSDHIEDVAGEVRHQLAQVGLSQRIRPGMRVAVTAGSRGITNIALVIHTVIEELKGLDARPFIVPAMGSHGGATAEGQIELLAEYGITEESMGVPILSSMETVIIGQTPQGAPVHMDRNAYNADAVVLVNRVKAHTSLQGPIQSGLCKIMAIGLGKQKGAESIHDRGLNPNVPEAAKVMIGTGKIALGIALVENSYHQTYKIVAAPPERIHETDRECLELSNSLLPRLPFDEMDVLVVDWMGKNISGSGMDTNVIGLWRQAPEKFPFTPMYRKLVVLNVTPESHGNCTGIGMADFTTRKLVSQIDYNKTYWNVLTGGNSKSGMIPITLDTDVDAVEVALRCARRVGTDFQLVRIKNTLELEEFYVTAPLLEQLRSSPEYEVVRALGSMPRDRQGNLLWG